MNGLQVQRLNHSATTAGEIYSLLRGSIFLLSKPTKLILLVSLHKEVCIKTNEVVLLKPMVRMKFKLDSYFHEIVHSYVV